jgi:Uma2 family endonuclease
MTVTLKRRLFTVDEYQRMGETGIIHEDERVELLDGEIFKMSPIGGPHIWCINKANLVLVVRLQGRAFVSIQNPVRLNDMTEPQPDVVVLRMPADPDAAEVPVAADVLLLIEVADSSLDYDRGEKLPRYAAAGIPEVWIADLIHKRVEVYRDPVGDRYHYEAIVERAGVLTPLAFPDVAIPCAKILP